MSHLLFNITISTFGVIIALLIIFGIREILKVVTTQKSLQSEDGMSLKTKLNSEKNNIMMKDIKPIQLEQYHEELLKLWKLTKKLETENKILHQYVFSNQRSIHRRTHMGPLKEYRNMSYELNKNIEERFKSNKYELKESYVNSY